jgi:ABC-2 type transport system permease protein
MPGSYETVMAGKIITYTLVCLAQCALMIVTGVVLLPLLGLPSLIVGNHPLAIIIVAICCGLAATGYGILVGTIFNTHQQSSTFGAVSVVILAALGGIWVPVFVMPEPVQLLAAISPLNWGLNAFQTVFLTAGKLTGIGLPLVKLILFFLFTFTIAYFVNKFKNN